ncbi:GIY-YIG nuclease family protein [Microbacterium candidum]|uniref:GIY-YIG nuclease family protein n=1 Tax=Microbacterium candidum TaxID=3041922 RepID=A0ABT7MV96_9MICO|nr:GIY-YIG nuclease family protein [Microbacterium sp. ASV49]MDL9978374.1 GIY-YIG nuclease family protein [Microbacterium sp. ASV49]
MTTVGELPGPCLLCGGTGGVRDGDGWACAVCGWRYGDAPDPDLPPPVVEVVYYLRYRDRIKIGTSRNPKQRLAAIWHEELLAFERGGRPLEQQRHREFSDLREGGEWFTAAPELLAHIERVRDGELDDDPWHAYARWIADAFR